ncbi:SRF-type transcription factor (DNA-binding and dimerization domain), partial [Musa troglodytarum]
YRVPAENGRGAVSSRAASQGRGPPTQVLPHRTPIVVVDGDVSPSPSYSASRRAFSVSQIGFRRGGRWRGEGGWSCGGSRTAPAARCASPSGGAACSRKPTSSPCSATPRSLSWSSPPPGSSTSSPAFPGTSPPRP